MNKSVRDVLIELFKKHKMNPQGLNYPLRLDECWENGTKILDEFTSELKSTLIQALPEKGVDKHENEISECSDIAYVQGQIAGRNQMIDIVKKKVEELFL